eukprot:gb/GECG01012471.1/.p1 GENE.gb/GECG01012471.1/~~gb/GECG01012471.1/.p1  ORF type:complete len:529 (+),score=71.58 gb/GECG01012471.1/:1-1587(+)
MEELIDEESNEYIRYEKEQNHVGEIAVEFTDPGGAPVFRPTHKQFSQGLRECMKAMSPVLREYGIGKVIPPSAPAMSFSPDKVASGSAPQKVSDAAAGDRKKSGANTKTQEKGSPPRTQPSTGMEETKAKAPTCDMSLNGSSQESDTSKKSEQEADERVLPPEIAELNPQNSSVCRGTRSQSLSEQSRTPWAHIDYDKTVPSTLIRPTTQAMNGSRGLFQVALLRKKKKIRIIDFWKRAKQQNALTPPLNGQQAKDEEEVDRAFWKSLSTLKQPPEYGADMLGSLFGEAEASGWNPDKLHTELKECLSQDLPGVTRAYLYIGMWRSMFAWHKEDMDLLSINYLHFGAPKTWYGVPPVLAKRFEAMAEGYFGSERRNCAQFLRHKTTLMSPKKLRDANISYVKLTQYPGEFVITYASAYHSGFNHGFNCAEAVNFATPAWIPFGHKAKLCKCWPDTVRINMYHFEDTFRLQLGLTPLYHYVKVIDTPAPSQKREREEGNGSAYGGHDDPKAQKCGTQHPPGSTGVVRAA